MSIRAALNNAVRRAKIENFTFHDLIHTFDSHLKMKGVDRGTVAELHGHENISTIKLYSHWTADHLSESVNRLMIK